MNKSDFEGKIRAAHQLLSSELDLLLTTSSLNSLSVNVLFNEVALDPEAHYQDIYGRALSASYYNFLLNDYSIFQFSWSSETAWRLAFLPNPWIAGVGDVEEQMDEWDELLAAGAINLEEMGELMSELSYTGAIPPIRFEYAVEQYRELVHPAAHLHIGRHFENRWPLHRVLNPLTFLMMILKMYYPPYWLERSIYFNHAATNCLDGRFIDELNKSRIVHDFSDNERASLHFFAQKTT